MSKTLRNVLIALCILAMLLSVISIVATVGYLSIKKAAPEVEVSEVDAPESALPGEVPEDIQYVMYLGTNDKDTNEPVYTPDEAKAKAEEILLDHFGGYTIQEANGGWKDGDMVYTEYTLVIYLSDTDIEAVHAAADEMIEAFHQSSVLIQANRTTTEFYAGAEG